MFVAPPGMEELQRRLVARGTESTAQVAERLGRAREEIAVAASLYDVIVVNDDLAGAVDQVVAVLSDAIGRDDDGGR